MKERLSPCLKFRSEEAWKVGAITVQGASPLLGCELVNKESHAKRVALEDEVEPRWGGGR